MKRFFVSLMVWCSMTVLAMAGRIPLTAGIIDPGAAGNDAPRDPVYVPSAEIEGNVLTVSDHPDYVLQIVDLGDADMVYYETVLPAGTNTVVLPATLSGNYEVRLIWGNWYFFGQISL
ncbi:MAG: hypothetical protein J6W56_04695 [Prevotella sp.]|nr:hypothetical protein [Prevotella sp.]